ncbi:hypothetical protein HPB48_000688 [Haemaphysalis longicornis]|uniref:Tonoplast dicarboxylate transporter n=1 Tax=Haemaphysalis longicornis TaxID=44386 RepID=A0A9J6GSP9_HAELO|nr:hypothetical protein HPB48_000688 [Haemaphysalis longicornis]
MAIDMRRISGSWTRAEATKGGHATSFMSRSNMSVQPKRRRPNQQQKGVEEEAQERSWRMTVTLAVPTLLLPLPLIMGGSAGGWCVYCMFWMAIYWTTEVIPLPATALIPLAMFPIMGVLSTNDTASAYFNDIGFMTLSSLTVAVAVEATNLHRRVALKALLVLGMSRRRQVAFDALPCTRID